jgi:hypothetical protein
MEFTGPTTRNKNEQRDKPKIYIKIHHSPLASPFESKDHACIYMLPKTIFWSKQYCIQI